MTTNAPASKSPSPQQLQLAQWIAQRDWASVDAMFDQADAKRNHPAGQLLRAELSALHGYAAESSWQDLLQQAVSAGLRPALIVALTYHCWSKHYDAVGALQSALNEQRPLTSAESQVLWREGWTAYSLPTWENLSSESAVCVEKSSAFLPPLIAGIICHTLAPHLRPATVIDPTTGNSIAHPIRRNNQTQWLPEQLGWMGKLLERRLALAASYSANCGEVLNLLHYAQGQEYRLHVDSLPSVQVKSETGRSQGGQRVATVLLSMNDNYQGGSTDFPKLDLSVKLETGRLLRFKNTDVSGASLPQSLHAGTAVTGGEKWLLSKWVRQHPTPYAGEINLTETNQEEGPVV